MGSVQTSGHVVLNGRTSRATATLLAPATLLLLAIGAVWWLMPTHGRTTGTPPVEQQAVSALVPVASRELVREIHLNGVLSYSQGQETHVAAPISGRVDYVAAHSAGDYVKSGERLFRIYSEDFFAAHQRLLRALNAVGTAEGSDHSFTLSPVHLLLAAREELLLLGISPSELNALEQVRAPDGLLPIRTRASGVLLDISIAKGSEVKRGERLCRLVEPDPIWLFLEASAVDWAWVLPGRRAKIIVKGESPKEVLSMVTVVSPAVNGATPTAKIGIPLPNPHQNLKPGMRAEAILRGPICSDGMPESTPLEGRFFCVRHPEIVRDVPGRCPKTGNLLAQCPVEHRMHQTTLSREAVAIPATAVLDLDGRKLVYRLRGHGASQKAEIVEIRVGLSAQGRDDHGNLKDYVPVISGLRIGDRVLTPIRQFMKRRGLPGSKSPPDLLLPRANSLWDSVACAFLTPNEGDISASDNIPRSFCMKPASIADVRVTRR